MAKLKESQSSFHRLKELERSSLFESFRVSPGDVDFHGKDTGEQIILFMRQHPIVLFPGFIKAILVLLVTVALAYGLTYTLSSLKVNIVTLNIILLVFGVFISITYMLYEVFKWFYTISMITTSRVIDLDFQTIFDSRWSSTTLRAIQDVSHTSPGFISTIFDVGSLQIQTAAEKELFEISNIPRPRDVQDVLMDLVDEERTGNV